MLPKVTIVFPNWNGLDDTIECLTSLKDLDYPNYNIIVVDNGSRNNEAKTLKDMFGSYIHVIENKENIGAAGANTQGIRFALENCNPDYLMSLNNDAVVAPDCLTELIKTAQSNPKVGIVGAKVYWHHDPNRIQFIGHKFSPWIGDVLGLTTGVLRILGYKEYDHGQYHADKESDIIAGWCELIDKKVIEKVGLFNPVFFFGWDDVDYSIRVKKAGFKIIYSHRARAWHKYKSSAVLDGHLQYHGPKLRFYLERLHTTKLQYLCFLLFFFSIHLPLATAYYALWIRRPWLLKFFYKGVWDGLTNKKIT